jgi:hypothetical protein
LPPELAHCRCPKNKTTAEAGAFALVEFLKKTDEPLRTPVDRITVGAWLEKFTHVEGNPKAALNEAKNRPYSINTIIRHEGEKLIKFIRMAFKQYRRIRPRWLNPFQGVEPPRAAPFDQMLRRQSKNSGKKTDIMNLCLATRTEKLRGRHGPRAGLTNGWPAPVLRRRGAG